MALKNQIRSIQLVLFKHFKPSQDDKKASGSRPSSGRRATGNKPSSDFMDSLFGGDSIGKKNDDATSTGQGRKNLHILNELLNTSYHFFRRWKERILVGRKVHEAGRDQSHSPYCQEARSPGFRRDREKVRFRSIKSQISLTTTLNFSSLDIAPASASGGRRRRGGPTTTSGSNLDLDDDKLFQVDIFLF